MNFDKDRDIPVQTAPSRSTHRQYDAEAVYPHSSDTSCPINHQSTAFQGEQSNDIHEVTYSSRILSEQTLLFSEIHNISINQLNNFSINIDFNQLSQEYKNHLFRWLYSQHQIDTFYITGGNLVDHDLIPMNQLTNLKSLQIFGNHNIHYDGIYQLKNLCYLEVLSITHNIYSPDNFLLIDDDAVALKYLVSLKSLDISKNNLTYKGVSFLRYLTKLLFLSISSNPFLSDDGVCELCGVFKYISNLYSLSIRGVDMTEKGAGMLMNSIKYLPHLSHIDTCDIGITTELSAKLDDSVKNHR